MYIGHDENRTANKIYLLDSLKYQKRNVQKVKLSDLLSWLFYGVCVFVEKQQPQSAYRVKYFRVWGPVVVSGFIQIYRN